jgi:uncharacterized protein
VPNQDLIAELAAAQELPEQALIRAVLDPSQIADAVLRVLDLAADGGEIAGGEENLLFWGIHVLGAARDTRAYRPLLRLLRQPEERLERLLGDAQVASLPKIVAGVFDGDAAPLEALLADPAVGEMSRMVLFGTLAFLTVVGRIERGATRRFLERFEAERLAERGNSAWVGWEEAVVRLGLRDLWPRVDKARRDGRVPDGFNDRTWLLATLTHAEAAPGDLASFAKDDFGYIDDILAELAWTALTPEEAVELVDALDGEDEFGADAPADEDAPTRISSYSGSPAANPLRNVGRNDPCPCGSGKKFKKCCLGK